MPKSFHPANIQYTPYAPWRVRWLARFAWLLGVRFHINGMPFGRHSTNVVRQIVHDIRNRPVTNRVSGVTADRR